MQRDLGLRGPDLDQLAGADPAGRHRVEIAVEGDQAVFAHVPQPPLGHVPLLGLITWSRSQRARSMEAVAFEANRRFVG
ncbi:hypothetical protein [Streptomyces griseofuscus]|uniref:hypothetical protein n=1 Tax=Streptomyces griseofuscus TaxID=146922 RepID=UPI003F519E97